MAGILILVPVTVYDSPVVYSICLIVSTSSVRDVVSEVIVPLVKLGTTGAARAEEEDPSKNKIARIFLI